MRHAPVALALLLVAAPASAETFRLDGVDSERGVFTGRLTLGAADAHDRLDARWEVWFEDGPAPVAIGALQAHGDRLRGTLRAAAGAAGHLDGATAAPLAVSLQLEGETCRGTARGPGGAARFVGRLGPADGTPQAPTRYAAAAAEPATAAARRQAAAWSDVPGETVAFAPAANGGRPVVVHLPPGFDPTGPVRVVTYLHGHGWDVGPALAEHGVLERVETLGAAAPQTVFVFPQAGPVPFRTWLKPPGESLEGIVAGAVGAAATLAGAEHLTVTRREVDAHSGGGLALANAALAGELHADKLNLIDCAYGTWAQTVARWAAKAAHRPRLESWYTDHASQAANNQAAARLAPGQVTLHAAGSVSQHNALPARTLGSE